MENPIAPRVNVEPERELFDPLDLQKDKMQYDRYDFYRRG